MSWHHLSDTLPRARKDYRCYLCELPIVKGQIHVFRSGITDDGPNSFRMHCECRDLSSEWLISDWESHDPAAFREDDLCVSLLGRKEGAP